MKVICIDATTRVQPVAGRIVEGQVYDAAPSLTGCECCYWIQDAGGDFNKNRFVPCSDIDETKLVNDKTATV